MNRALLISTLILSTSFAFAKTSQAYLKSASYNCNVDSANKHLKSKSEFILQYQDLGGAKGAQINLNSKDKALSLVAVQEPTDSVFLPKSGNVYNKKNSGYVVFYDSHGFEQIELVLAYQLEPGLYRNDRLNCELSAPAVMGQLDIQKLDCVTLDQSQNFSFKLIGANDVSHLSVSGRFSMKPRNSIMNSLNENLSVRDLGSDIKIFGDSAGIDFATIILNKTSGLKSGTLKLESDGKKILSSKITCEVK